MDYVFSSGHAVSQKRFCKACQHSLVTQVNPLRKRKNVEPVPLPPISKLKKKKTKKMKIWWCAITEQAAETLAGHIFLTSIVCLFWCYGLFVYNLARFNPPFLFLFPSFPSISHIAVKAYLCFPKIYPFFFQTHGGFLSFVLFVLFVLFVFTQRGKGTDVQRRKKNKNKKNRSTWPVLCNYLW